VIDPSLLEVKGAKAQVKYEPLVTLKFIAGLMTQRSPFASIDTRYGSRFLGGKPDALIDGKNCEITNRLTLARRPGLVPYGAASVPAVNSFYDWQETKPSSIQLMVDTATAVYNYSTLYAGIDFNKDSAAVQTNFYTLVNTMYMGDGVDLFKKVGPNLLIQSNTFNNSAAWSNTGSITFATGQTDPLGGTTATQLTWGAAAGSSYLLQAATINTTPIASNVFTFSVWVKAGTGTHIRLICRDQNSVGTDTVFTVTGTWTRYQVTATLVSNSNVVNCFIDTTDAINTTVLVYGAQCEVGGPAKPTEITTTLAQGIFKWGIVAPATAPTLTFALSGPARWVASHAYNTGNQVTDSNGNLQTVTSSNGTSGSTEPTWATTQNSSTTDNNLTWREDGPSGLSPKTGYKYYYAYENSITGHLSNVSPISADTGALIGQSITVTGARSTDVQVDTVVIFRNTDGGAFYYQLTTVTNPAAGTWTFTDTTQDTGLNTSLFAPLGKLNSPPPAGLINMEFHQSRLWGSVGATLYYAAGPDNASLINIVFNGVFAESWPAANTIPFNAPIIRLLSTNAGLLVFTTQDIWIVTGSDLSTFNPTRLFAGHGMRSYNALDIDGSTVIAYLADRQFLTINPNTGSMELGFPVGNLLEATFNPANVYITRHVSGSQDNAIYIANGVSGWFRLNPNQVGASMSGEQAPLWSPFARLNVGNDVKAIASIETSPGIHQLLVGQNATGQVLVRDLRTFTDNGANYTWFATIGSLLMASSGTLAEVESITTDVNPGLIPFQSDLFQRAALGSNWTTNGSAGMEIFASFEAESADLTGLSAAARWTNPLFNADQSSRATIVSNNIMNPIVSGNANTSRSGVAVRMDTGNANTYYLLFTNGGNTLLVLAKHVAGVETTLVTFPYAVVAGDVIELQVKGTALTALLNGIIVMTATDSDIASGQPGIYSVNNGTFPKPQDRPLGNWIGASLPTAVAPPTVSVLLDEIDGLPNAPAFEVLSTSVPDPPQIGASIVSYNSNRYYLMQGATTPVVKHMQLKLTGLSQATLDEVLSITVRGALIPEQEGV